MAAEATLAVVATLVAEPLTLAAAVTLAAAILTVFLRYRLLNFVCEGKVTERCESTESQDDNSDDCPNGEPPASGS